MKSDVNGVSQCQEGTESYESFYSRQARRSLVQYDYRTPAGALFSTVAYSLPIARERRDKWLSEQEKVTA